jgi:hypothetical protein
MEREVDDIDSILVSEPPTASEGANYARALGDPWMYLWRPAVVSRASHTTPGMGPGCGRQAAVTSPQAPRG